MANARGARTVHTERPLYSSTRYTLRVHVYHVLHAVGCGPMASGAEGRCYLIIAPLHCAQAARYRAAADKGRRRAMRNRYRAQGPRPASSRARERSASVRVWHLDLSETKRKGRSVADRIARAGLLDRGLSRELSRELSRPRSRLEINGVPPAAPRDSSHASGFARCKAGNNAWLVQSH